MQFEIQRVPADIDPEEFESSFYRTRTPVIVEGVARDWPATRTWDPDTLRAHIEEVDSKLGNWFWVLPSDFRKGDYQTPAILSHLRRTYELRFSERPVRVWIAGHKTRTGWHYDRDSKDGLNVQVKGKKRFVLVSPETPLGCYAFNHHVRRFYAGTRVLDAHHDYTIFDLAAGDMLFLPRYWFHTVESQEEININLNWLWTDLDTPVVPSSRTAVRERECVALRLWVRRTINRLRRRQPPRAFFQYGFSKDSEVAERFYRVTPFHRLLLRAALEFAAFPPGWIALRRQRRIELELHGGVPRTSDEYFKRSEPDNGSQTPGSI